MKKKIALMTWYTYYNYGTVLQAVSLYKIIKQLGYNVDIINYMPKKNRPYSCEKVYYTLLKKMSEKLKVMLNPSIVTKERKHLYSDFLLNNITLTNICRSFPELYALNEKYDAFVCGSDQIWSPLDYDDKYFLKFVDEEQKMVAYAPSMGTNKIDNEYLKVKLSQNIKRFVNLSVRERDGVELIKHITGKEAKIVLDPTFLMSKDNWNNFIDDNVEVISDKKYIICYFLGKNEKYSKYVSELSKKTGIPYYVIPVKKNQFKNPNKVPFEIGPKEFVSLIKNACYVCTDSFHGMAFSIIYNVPFTAFKRFSDKDSNNQNSRLINLLETLNLTERLIPISRKYDFSEFEKCDFEFANNILEKMREESMLYLEQSLKNASNSSHRCKEFKITDNCCGCGACYAVCPTEAVTLLKNNEGFEHYIINKEKCIECGKCKTVCPMNVVDAPEVKNSLGLYSVTNQSKQAEMASSSGGVGYAVSQFGIKNGYYVCGCSYDRETSSAKHILISPKEASKITMLQGSKYIQSSTADALKKIKNMSSDDKLIFFGTPCQVAAVRKVVKKSLKNVIFVDLICHGVPTYHLWAKYIEEIDKKYCIGKNPEVFFRDKTENWHRRKIKIQGNGKTYLNSERKDDFYAFFRRGICDMKACSECPYREKSSADLRIGDYWGTRFKNDKNPVSMVIANTSVGYELLSQLKNENCTVEKQNLQEYWSVQHPYNLKQILYREEIISELQNKEKSLHELRNKYCKYYDLLEFFEGLKAKADKLKNKC